MLAARSRSIARVRGSASSALALLDWRRSPARRPGRAAADALTLTTPFPAIAVAPGSTVELRHLDRRPPRRPGRPDGRQGARPAGRRSCAAAASPSTASSRPAASAADQGDPRTSRSRPTRPPTHAADRRRAARPAARLDDAAGRHPGRRRTRPGRHPDHRHAAAQGRLERELHVQPDPHQRHARGPAVQRRPRPDRPAGPSPPQVGTDGAGRERRRQGRRDDAGHRDRQGRRPMPPPGTYPIAVDATSGSQTAHQDLSVEITGSYTLTLIDRRPAPQHERDGRRRERPDALRREHRHRRRRGRRA